MWRLLAIIAVVALAARAAEFNHKTHAPLKLECGYCHAGAAKAERAGFPANAKCMLCHATLAQRSELLEADRKFTARYNKIPDFVNFSHAKHQTAGCAACHGAVWEVAAGAPHPWKMKACVDCHKIEKAKVTCDVCHELGQ